MEQQRKNILSNRHEVLLGQRQNPTKPFPLILGRGREKLGILCHKTPPDMAPYNNETHICQSNRKYMENSKDRQTETGRGCAGTTNPGVTQKPDNPLKGIWNLIPRKPDNPLKGIRNLVTN